MYGYAPAEGKRIFLVLLRTKEIGLLWGQHVAATAPDAAGSANDIPAVADNNYWHHHLMNHANGMDRKEYIVIICCDRPKTWSLA